MNADECLRDLERIVDAALPTWDKHVVQLRGGRRIIYEGEFETMTLSWNREEAFATREVRR